MTDDPEHENGNSSGEAKNDFELNEMDKPESQDRDFIENPNRVLTAAEMEAVFDVPVRVSAILGRSKMKVADLLKINTGTVIELDRKIGEAIDIYVNNRLVARGEVVLVEDKLGVTMTEVIKAEK